MQISYNSFIQSNKMNGFYLQYNILLSSISKFFIIQSIIKAYPETKITGRGKPGIRLTLQRDLLQLVSTRPICTLIDKPKSINSCIVVDDNGGSSQRRSKLYTKKSPPPKPRQPLIASIPSSMSCV